MKYQADHSLLRWLMLPAMQADVEHLADRRACDCARGLRVASQRLHGLIRGVSALHHGEAADLARWLRSDLTTLRNGMCLAGAWVYASRLRRQTGQAVTAALARLLGSQQLLVILRSDDLYQGSLPPIWDTDDVLAAGGSLMYEHCRRVTPMLADRLMLRFSSGDSWAWSDAPQVQDDAWRERVARCVLRTQPEVMA